ncbi:MAG TPA: EamA family transporter [Candidatus Limnocylindrales bacterium]
MRRGTTWVWIPFLALAFIWGTSYLWIKVGLESLPPLTLVAGRLVLGAAFVALVAAIARQPLPRSPRQYGHLFVMSIVNIVIPFLLITIGEQSLDSALAAILNSTVPLFVIVIAPMFLPDERITAGRIAGLAIGFAGVVWLVAPGLSGSVGGSVPAELMMVASSLAYACGNVYARRNTVGLAPMIPALFQVGFAAAVIVPLALVVDRPWSEVHPAPEALLAVLWLGVLGSGLAYLFFFTILRHWGSMRTSMVSYLLPVVGIAAGALVLGEAVTANRIGGTVLIVAGIAIVSSPSAVRRIVQRWRSRDVQLDAEAEPAAPGA